MILCGSNLIFLVLDFFGWAENPAAGETEKNRDTVVLLCFSFTFQSLEDSLIAFRTRSKRPLKDVPLGQLEAELRAPDITPDMYDPNTADDEEWKRWLGGLMNDDVENEGIWQMFCCCSLELGVILKAWSFFFLFIHDVLGCSHYLV